MQKNKTKADIDYDLYDYYSEIEMEMFHELMEADMNTKQKWKVVSANDIKLLYKEYEKYGFIRSEKKLEEIRDRLVRNIIKLEIDTALCGHADYNKLEEWKSLYEINDEDYKRLEEICDEGAFFDTEDGSWRLSDYGLPKLVELLPEIYREKDSEKLMIVIDKVLNIVHQRNDLAAMFVEGGSRSLFELSKQGAVAVLKQEEKIIYHGSNTPIDNFDIKKTADGTVWFTDNKEMIEKGEVGASGKGYIIERIIDESKLKLGGWKEDDKYGTQELIEMGYDGLKLPSGDETTYRIYHPKKLKKVKASLLKNDIDLNGISFKIKILYNDEEIKGYKLWMYYKNKEIGNILSYMTDDYMNEQEYIIHSEYRNKGFGKLLLLYGIAKDIELLNSHAQDARGITEDMKRTYKSLIAEKALNNDYSINYTNKDVEEIIETFNDNTSTKTGENKEVKAILAEEQYEIYDVIKRYSNKWLHFSDGVPKWKGSEETVPMLTINPQKKHRDPYGIYFYYIPNVLKNIRKDEDYDSIKYGITKKYYYIVDLKLKKAKGLILNTLTYDKALEIADRNGWGKYFEKIYYELTSLVKPDFLTFKTNVNSIAYNYKLLKKGNVGAVFYTVGDILANYKDECEEIFKDFKGENFTWTRLLKGVDYLLDKGKGIINESEPYQIVVINKSIIDILDFGENKDLYSKKVDEAYFKVIEQLGGKAQYKNKNIEGYIVYNDIKIPIKIDKNSGIHLTVYKNGFNIDNRIYISEAFHTDRGYLESDIKTVIFYINRELKEIEPEPQQEVQFDYYKLNELIMVRFNKFHHNSFSFRNRITDDIMEIWGYSYNESILITVKKDNVEIKLHEDDFDFKRDAKSYEEIEQVMNDYFKEYTEWRQRRYKKLLNKSTKTTSATSSSVLLIHHIEHQWDKSITEDYLVNVCDFLIENKDNYDKIILTVFEDWEKKYTNLENYLEEDGITTVRELYDEGGISKDELYDYIRFCADEIHEWGYGFEPQYSGEEIIEGEHGDEYIRTENNEYLQTSGHGEYSLIYDYLKNLRGEKVDIIGGAETECLRDLVETLDYLKVEYEVLNKGKYGNLIYGELIKQLTVKGHKDLAKEIKQSMRKL